MPKGDAKPGEHVDPRGRMPCLWTGEGGNGLWSDAGNWKGGRIPGSSDVVRLVAFSGPATITIPNTATIGRLEVELQDAEITTTCGILRPTPRCGLPSGPNSNSPGTVPE